METLLSSISSISLLLGIAGLWMIFQYNGEAPWKSLIPFYSTYIFSRTFYEEELGKKLAWSKFISSIIAIPFAIAFMAAVVIAASLALGGGIGLLEEVDFVSSILSESHIMIIFLFFILLMILVIFVMVFHIKLHYRYTLYKDLPSWFMFIWILAPGIGYFYCGMNEDKRTEY